MVLYLTLKQTSTGATRHFLVSTDIWNCALFTFAGASGSLQCSRINSFWCVLGHYRVVRQNCPRMTELRINDRHQSGINHANITSAQTENWMRLIAESVGQTDGFVAV